MTAIEWLTEQLDIDLVDNGWYFEKAKEMEKQEKIDFADKYGTYLLQGGTRSAATYNEIFNKE